MLHLSDFSGNYRRESHYPSCQKHLQFDLVENLNLRGGFRTEIFDFIRREYPHLISLYHEIDREGRSDEWRVLDEEIRVFAAEEGLDYAVADDTMRRPFDAPPLIVNWFFHEQVRRTAKKR